MSGSGSRCLSVVPAQSSCMTKTLKVFLVMVLEVKVA